MGVVMYDAGQCKLATQAIEDWFELNKPSLIAAIDAATAPLVMNGKTKRILISRFIEKKGQKEAVEPEV
jgi:hypothetical protein